MYTIKFALEGFATIERTGFQLQSDLNARVDQQMKVGTLNETITVTGAAPIVDVQSASHVALLDRDSLDNVPNSKTIWGLGQLIVGVALSAPDVGGSASGMPTYMSMRGGAVGANNNTLMVDGMVLNALSGNGAVPPWVNDANFQEVTYQTAGIGADRSGGGVVVNMVPKEGGNRFSGNGSGAYRPGELQGDNYTERFKVWGLPLAKGEPAINRVVRISDFSVGQGGPLQRDKLWFFVAARDQQPINTVPNTFLDDGSQGVDDNYCPQRERPPDLSGQPETQVVRELRTRVLASRSRHVCAGGSGNDRPGLDVAEFLDDGGEVHGDAEQQNLDRGRVCSKHRVLPHFVSTRRPRVQPRLAVHDGRHSRRDDLRTALLRKRYP